MKKVVLLLSLCPIFYLGQIKEMITGGEGVHISQVPYQVAIYKNGNFSCGGSILNQEWILTAAHCVEEPFTYAIKVGISRLDEVGTSFNVGQKVVHPNYNKVTMDNDIALIKINGIINYNTNVQPAKFPNSIENLYDEGRMAIVSGWGRVDPLNAQPSNQLNKVEVPIISNSLASSQLDKVDLGHPSITSNMIATGAVSNDRKGTCYGDSGGPLVTRDQFGVIKQIGIVSWGARGCVINENSPSVYVRLSNYIDWIKQYVSLSSNVEGKNTLCNAETATYTFDASGASFAWQVSDNLMKNSETGSSIIITPKPNATGAAYIKAIIDGKEITKKIWIGKPQVRYEITDVGYDTVNYELVSTVPNVSIEDQGVNATCDLMPYAENGNLRGDCYKGRIKGIKRNSSITMETTVSNACEIVKTILYYKPAHQPCNGYSITQLSNESYQLVSKPCEPAIQSHSMLNEAKVDNVQIVNAMGQTVLTTTDTTFSINHLLSGTYYARVIKDGQVVHTQTLIKK